VRSATENFKKGGSTLLEETYELASSLLSKPLGNVKNDDNENKRTNNAIGKDGPFHKH
jgi:hypothetical protein